VTVYTNTGYDLTKAKALPTAPSPVTMEIKPTAGNPLTNDRVDGSEKRGHFGAQVVPLLLRLLNEPFPLSGKGCSERPGAVKGAPLLGAAKRTLDGEDGSKDD
jgi:hypothetical protein